jgi:hypothetical protein
LLIILIALFDSGRRSRAVRDLALTAVAAFGALSVIGTSVGPLYGLLKQTAFIEFDQVLVRAIPQALAATKLGIGTGSDTSATRHLHTGWENAPVGVEGQWLESWWIKMVLEIGVIGLAIGVLFFASLVVIGWRSHRGVDPKDPLSSASAAFLAVLIWCLIYNTKGGVIDVDPLNVYFWMSAGALLKMPEIAGSDP